MTKEEAIEFGKIWIEINEDCKDSNTYSFFQMAVEALKNYKPKKPYERFLPCKCGCNRREEWTSYVKGTKSKTLVCKKCGYTVIGKYFADAKRNWNKEMGAEE